MTRKSTKQWTWLPAKSHSPVTKQTKTEVQDKAQELIDDVLKPSHIQPPPKVPRFNYVIDIFSKWHGSYFYFGSKYACPGPKAISPTFEMNFARMEHVGNGKFNLAYMRHTGKWWEVFTDLTLDEALECIRENELFHP